MLLSSLSCVKLLILPSAIRTSPCSPRPPTRLFLLSSKIENHSETVVEYSMTKIDAEREILESTRNLLQYYLAAFKESKSTLVHRHLQRPLEPS